MKHLTLIICILLLTSTGVHPQQPPDILDRVLSEVGFSRADLGYRPTGYWNRFPLDVPHRLTSFDALFAEPLKLIDYATVMANTVEFYLDPAYSDSAHDGLYKLTYNLGVDKKLGGFRSYSANLLGPPTGDEPMVTAIDNLFALAGRSTEFHTFGAKSDWPDYKQEIRDQSAGLPDTVRLVVAQLLINLTDAIRWRNLAFRNCDHEDMYRAFSIRDLSDTQADGMVYYPELDDLAKSIDWPSLHYAALKVAAAVEQAEAGLIGLVDQIPDEFEFRINTPFGHLSMFAGPFLGFYECDATSSLLIIDFGRDTHYPGSPGATASLNNPISVVLDLGGDDVYGDRAYLTAPSAGVGLLGVGLLLDSKGNDQYYGTTLAQGAGLFGVGVLLDREGNDSYQADLSAQGAGYFGIGLCLDGLGDDTYYLYGDGQGMGGVGGGVGVCASFGGSDKYTAEPFSENFNRGDYHSEHKINGNNAQGAGFGRRGDGSDGHAWAGGLGAIIDIHGDDHYYSGNWTLGVGYWFATGIAVDRHGDDIYESCYFTQGSGAHYCNGILLDENGHDRHELFETAGAALGFGWDYTNAFLINLNGDDVYRAKMISMGLAQIRSNAFLVDIGGDDAYYLGKGTPGLGEATFRPDYLKPSKLTPYYTYAKSFGAFIDIGGADQYYEFDEDSETEHPVATNNKLWLQPTRSDSTFGADNFGVGIDTDNGTVPEFFRWD
ncbi:MAG: hypothetical protein OEV49_08785 [candidate division Zixibacteria bacterium]|nr:hypothetical protein [candidate division Zixibacteria bacterium]MDH3936446.1 hypothetical protein [candidate division Zixibacteria bacterium]MDH4032615.1 hypothetical protein [candidate division Zixibacteria bacterium]